MEEKYKKRFEAEWPLKWEEFKALVTQQVRPKVIMERNGNMNKDSYNRWRKRV